MKKNISSAAEKRWHGSLHSFLGKIAIVISVTYTDKSTQALVKIGENQKIIAICPHSGEIVPGKRVILRLSKSFTTFDKRNIYTLIGYPIL